MLLVILLPSNGYASACQTTFSVAWLEWKPYQMLENNRITGLDIALLKAIMDHAGCPYQLKNIPWERTKRYIKSGEIDLAIGASKTPERASWANFSEPYRSETMAIFVRTDEYPIWNAAHNFEQLARLTPRAAVIHGAFYGEAWNQIKDELQVHQLSQYEQLFKMLHIRRTNIVLNDLYNGKVLLQEFGFEDQITTLDWHASIDQIHFMFSQKTVPQADIDRINHSIRQLRQSGRLEEIISAYH
ncbi:transporter substrate-binding domain-containing protein [Amphritea sp. 1_MG-2023]|nr:transporter substrate-binding domain-containing protein [Amphritea sp. 1_MG-2023]MDO6562036.1 transporter substrate-binding domain-containing protein [Amphritea sp. 1_MG-2023]